jgi:DNA-binding MarR family transcriptional regulator
MSRQTRGDLETDLSREVRGWQVDQDLFDDALAMLARLNRTDMRCLDLVAQHGPITAGELATMARLTSGAITAVLDRLEERGLVRRVRDTGDRRRVLVEVATDLDALAAPAFEPFLEDARRNLATYSDRDVAVIVRFLRDSREVLVKHTARLHDLLARQEGDREDP